MTAQVTARIVARVHPKHGPILFINSAPARVGFIVCYTRATQHSEASTEYYDQTHGDKDDYCGELLREWKGQPPANVKVDIRQRMDWSMQRKAWGYV